MLIFFGIGVGLIECDGSDYVCGCFFFVGFGVGCDFVVSDVVGFWIGVR